MPITRPEHAQAEQLRGHERDDHVVAAEADPEEEGADLDQRHGWARTTMAGMVAATIE